MREGETQRAKRRLYLTDKQISKREVIFFTNQQHKMIIHCLSGS